MWHILKTKFITFNQPLLTGKCHGLVVTQEDSISKSRGFESYHWLIDHYSQVKCFFEDFEIRKIKMNSIWHGMGFFLLRILILRMCMKFWEDKNVIQVAVGRMRFLNCKCECKDSALIEWLKQTTLVLNNMFLQPKIC